MDHLVMPKSAPQCMLYSAAMALDMAVEDIINILGHDGMDVVNDNPPPFCYRGVHIQEIQTIAHRSGILFAPIDVCPSTIRAGVIDQLEVICGMDYATRFLHIIKSAKGIIIGTNGNGNPHAVAFDDGLIYDPIGRKYPISHFRTQTAWLMR